MEYFVQVLINALVLGLTYALIALGLAMVYSIMGLFNFAHGELYMLGGFIVYFFYRTFEVNYFVAILFAIVAISFFGFVMERLFFRPLRGKPVHASFLVSIGLNMVLSTGALVIFGERYRGVGTPIAGSIRILGAYISCARIVLILGCLFMILLAYLFVARTKLGQAMLAASQDRIAASLYGVDVNKCTAAAFAIGGGLAAAAAGLMLPLYLISPFTGTHAVLKALIVIILGGLGNIWAVLVGGLALGFIEAWSTSYLGNVSAVIGWIAVIFILAVRPHGLVGLKEQGGL